MVFCMAFTRGRKAKISICWYFFTEGAIMGNWAGVIPTAKSEQNISNAVLGAVLVAAILGALSALPMVSWMTKRWGSGTALFFGAVLTLLLFPLVGIQHNLLVFVVGVYLLGFGLSWADVAMNTQAVLCERVTRLPTLGLFHSMYALGGLVGALIGGVLLQRGLNVFGEVIAVGAGMFAPQLFFSCWLYSQQEERLLTCSGVVSHHQQSFEKLDILDTHALIGLPTSDSSPRDPLLNVCEDVEEQADWQVFERPREVDRTMLLSISALCFLGYLGYGSVSDWSAIYLSDDLDSNALQSTLGFVGFSLCVGIGTFVSDGIVLRFGRKKLLQWAGILAAIGLSVAVSASSIPNANVALACAVIGFSICGMGLSVVSPSVISLAGSSDTGMNSSDAIAFVSSVGYVGIMVGPPLLGGISAILNGLRWSFLVDAVLMLLITFLASFLKIPHRISNINSDAQEEVAIQ